MSFVQNFWNHWNTSHNAFIRAMRQTIMDQILSSDEEKTDNKPETSNAENNTTEKNNTEHGKNDKENRNLNKAKAKNMKEEKNFNTTDTEIEIEKNKDNEVKTKFKNNRMNEVREKNVKKYNKTKNVKKHDKLNNDIPKELPSITECIVRILLGWAGFDESRYDDENEWGCTNWCEYVVVVVLAAILLIASLTLTLFWIMYYREGFSWDTNPKLQFNLHPVLMVAGFITFSGFSILLYRICRCFRRIYVKLIHTIFHALAIPCIVVGFLAVLEYHNNSTPPIPNFYSMHSWLGFITMGLFALQFVFGFFSFLILLCCEGATAAFRASMVPIHASFGLTTFMLAIATCLTGLTEKAIFTLGDDYSKGNLEGLVMNVLAIVLIALGILVSYTVRSTTIRPDDSTVFHAKVMSAGSGASAGPY